MNKTTQFRTLVNILFILLIMGIVGIMIFLPFGITGIDKATTFEELSTIYWIIIGVSLLSYFIFLKGIFYLRKVAFLLLKDKQFSDPMIHYLNKSGRQLTLTGILILLTLIINWLATLMQGTLKFGYNENTIIPLFLIVIGMFFSLQSNTLRLGKTYKDENELTI